MDKTTEKKFDKEKHQSAILDLFRKAIEGVQLDGIKTEQLEGEQRLEFLKYCSEVASSPYFEQVMKELFVPQIMAAANTAENYDIVTFHRATANGISLVREFFQKQNRRYHEEFEPEENKGFDKTKPFDTSEADQFFKV